MDRDSDWWSQISAQVEAQYRDQLAVAGPEERVRLASAMFGDGRRMLEARIRAADPSIDEVGVRQAMFLHLYGDEFPPTERERILAGIAAAWRRSQDLHRA